jgi:hypothetical protein
MENKEIAKIRKTADLGDATFKFIEKTESILQGWSTSIGRTIYLFKMDTGEWGYFDKESGQFMGVTEWRQRAALVYGKWVKMSLYHRVHLVFTEDLTYAEWDPSTRKEYFKLAPEAIVTITDLAYKSLLEQMSGRDPESTYKLVFTTRKMGKKNVTFADKVVWVK